MLKIKESGFESMPKGQILSSLSKLPHGRMLMASSLQKIPRHESGLWSNPNALQQFQQATQAEPFMTE